MRVRLVRITGVDLNVFDFDHDLTWAGFFMNAEGVVYGRFGGRDAEGPDTRNSLVGLRFAMESALATHRRLAHAKPDPRPPKFVERFPAARQVVRNGCIHCHQVNEIRRQQEKEAGTWKRDNVWVYPLPENVGISLDVDRGNVVRSVAEGTPAAKLGMKAGDTIEKLDGHTIFSFADAQYALHHAVNEGAIAVSWSSAGQRKSGSLKVARGWRKTNLTWRPSMLDLIPNLKLTGPDLTVQEKKSLGLDEKQLAFRQAAPVHSEAEAMGVRAGDVILGVDNCALTGTREQFLAYVRQNYLVGDRATIAVLRAEKRVELRVKMR